MRKAGKEEEKGKRRRREGRLYGFSFRGLPELFQEVPRAEFPQYLIKKKGKKRIEKALGLASIWGCQSCFKQYPRQGSTQDRLSEHSLAVPRTGLPGDSPSYLLGKGGPIEYSHRAFLEYIDSSH